VFCLARAYKRPSDEDFKPTVKFGGGSMMVWRCSSYRDVGKLVFIDGKKDAAKYVDILSNNLEELAILMGLSNYTFQQDNDPKHTSRLSKSYFTNKNFDLLPWSTQSSDLNPIKTLWALIKKKLEEIIFKNLHELEARIVQEWNAIPKELFKKLALSLK
jgi:hypothetical protein